MTPYPKDITNGLAFIVRNSIAYIKELEAELARCKQVCAATAEAWREEAALAEPVQQGCEHCNQPLYAAVKCRVCGRVTSAEPVALDWLHKWANQDDGEPETQWHEGYEAARRVVQIHLTAPPQRKPPATIDEMFDRMNKAPKGVFFGHDPMTIWMEAWRAAEQQHGIT